MDRPGPVTVIGAGPAGLSAAIYLQRAGFGPLVLERDIPGGLLRRASVVENYPGFPGGIAAARLADLFLEQFRDLGGQVMNASADRLSRCDDGTYTIATSAGTHRSEAVIVATGTKARSIDIDGLRAAGSHRVFYDILDLLDAARPGERVTIYGGGDAAFDHGLNLVREGFEVAIVCRSKARSLPLLRERADRAGIRIVEGWPITRVISGERLGLEIEGVGMIEIDRLLMACGREPQLDILDPPLIARSTDGDITMAASVPGLFLAGDVVAEGRRQVGIAVGSGLTAAMMAERYLRG